ncbi:hypothetical protein [Edaphobacter albus]|uniref:hypothetical protein n=1 Tax=Edaphobacter sp. 4G125 TaxID=2763071 RepID=UPI00164608A8|nr:hypothetical protein [Edaphobacter sp. 4G125]QNI36617.1 hypothetical protein H7846_16985 [Edaphobacter sp. 4G125]
MNILPKIPPSSVRSGSSVPPAAGTRSPEPRLYLLRIRQSASVIKRPLKLFPHESEDARLTGETRSLYRRLLALNLPIVAESITRIEAANFEKIA